jgi:hypothetical protein
MLAYRNFGIRSGGSISDFPETDFMDLDCSFPTDATHPSIFKKAELLFSS